MAFEKDVDAHVLIQLVPDTPHEMPVAELILWSVRARCIRCYAATCRACLRLQLSRLCRPSVLALATVSELQPCLVDQPEVSLRFASGWVCRRLGSNF